MQSKDDPTVFNQGAQYFDLTGVTTEFRRSDGHRRFRAVTSTASSYAAKGLDVGLRVASDFFAGRVEASASFSSGHSKLSTGSTIEFFVDIEIPLGYELFPGGLRPEIMAKAEDDSSVASVYNAIAKKGVAFVSRRVLGYRVMAVGTLKSISEEERRSIFGAAELEYDGGGYEVGASVSFSSVREAQRSRNEFTFESRSTNVPGSVSAALMSALRTETDLSAVAQRVIEAAENAFKTRATTEALPVLRVELTSIDNLYPFNIADGLAVVRDIAYGNLIRAHGDWQRISRRLKDVASSREFLALASGEPSIGIATDKIEEAKKRLEALDKALRADETVLRRYALAAAKRQKDDDPYPDVSIPDAVDVPTIIIDRDLGRSALARAERQRHGNYNYVAKYYVDLQLPARGQPNPTTNAEYVDLVVTIKPTKFPMLLAKVGEHSETNRHVAEVEIARGGQLQDYMTLARYLCRFGASCDARTVQFSWDSIDGDAEAKVRIGPLRTTGEAITVCLAFKHEPYVIDIHGSVWVYWTVTDNNNQLEATRAFEMLTE